MTGSLTQSRRKPNLVSKNDIVVYLGHENILSACNLLFAEGSLRVRYVAPNVGSVRKIRVSLYRRTPLDINTTTVKFRYSQSTGALGK